jgi:8-oxo-dGTP pyrophosphatase MutT (NUDIX family)
LRSAPAGFEVLMQRRGAALAFMGGMWVFPGGRHDPADCSAAMLERVRVDAATDLSDIRSVDGSALERDFALGLHVTACRETFEESGVLLASDAAGQPRFDAAHSADLVARRAEVARSAADFARLLRDTDHYLDVSRLVYWSHWITPVGEKRRFDTRFFAIAVPDSQTTGTIDQESSEQRWIRPADALADVRSGTITAAPPTIFTLEDLVECEAGERDLERMLATQRGRPVPPIRPVLARTSEGFQVRMPWDAEYDPGRDEPLARPATYPERFARRPSRVRLDPGFALRTNDKGPAV